MSAVLRLTAFQASEVSGLLDVAADEVAAGSEGWTVWGTLTGLRLEVHNPTEAATELEHRAEWHENEAPEHLSNGGPAARSLRTLAAKARAL